jgi:site-specific recombinase XerD
MKKNNLNSSLVFWDTAKEYLYHYLPDVRKASPNTVAAYQSCLNHYIDYLEQQKACLRKNISFSDFNRERIKEYMDWMLNERLLAPKTCNLRLTAIHSLLEYASNEYAELMPSYLSVCSVKNIKTSSKPIEFFEPSQTKALLSAPNTTKKTERRNQMMLILLYDTAARVSELLSMKINSLHLSSEIPYVTIYGKGRKYRNIPLMNKTQQHLKLYLKEFHNPLRSDDPLFYAVTHGERHSLSTDTMEVMLKRYVKECISIGTEMPSKPHCHMIRKTRAMDLYQNGVPLTHIQQLLGHEDLSTTSGFYAFATLETLAKSMERLNESRSARKWDNQDTLAKIYRL